MGCRTGIRWLTGLTVLRGCLLLMMACRVVSAQTIQPLIVEYTGAADGRFEVTNDTLAPMAVVLEPKSFSIAPDGRGVYRALDPEIHLKLSSTSFRLEPKQSSYVFYTVKADRLPAWFTVYASFLPVQRRAGITVRMMLPHTVYLYQKKPIAKDSIHVDEVAYQGARAMVTCDIENRGSALVRVQEVRAVAGRKVVEAAGFPLLPGGSRHVSIDWTEKGRPEFLVLRFPHFELKEPLKARDP